MRLGCGREPKPDTPHSTSRQKHNQNVRSLSFDLGLTLSPADIVNALHEREAIR
jgi:hypothetical protein